MNKTLMIATQNQHKLEEFKQLWPGVSLVSLNLFPDFLMPPETGDTFLANSMIKSRAVFEKTGRISLADDSGLVVESLGGAPGVRSARYVPGTDRDRYLALLQALEGSQHRTAKFVTCLSIVGLPLDISLPSGVFRHDDVVYVHGEVHGKIALQARGTNGFGYDPVFELADGRTMGQMSPEEKQSCSHRARAAQILRPLLINYFS